MIILLLLLAHLIADFWMQSDEMVKHKIRYLNKHICHHLLTTGIALAIIWGYQYDFQHIMTNFIFPFVFIIITHLLIDFVKIKFIDALPKSPMDNMKKLGYFLADQVLHVMIILTACMLFFHTTLAEMTANLLNGNDSSNLSLFNTVLFISIISILATSVSGHIVKFIIGSLPSEFANFEGELTLKNQIAAGKEKIRPERDKSFTEEYHYFTYSAPLRSRGKLIGCLERLLVILLIAVGAYQSIAFIIAAKSIARFKQLDDRNWAEYFLLGTLSSIFLGLVLGLVVQGVLM